MNLEQRIAKYVVRDRKVATNCLHSFTNIFDCADSHYSEGTVCYKCTPSNKNSHQFRLSNNSLHKFATQVEKELQTWNEIESFEDLFAKIKTIAKKIKDNSKDKEKLGELVIYDCAARIAYLKFVNKEGDYRPYSKVYIHAGVYKGAKWLHENNYITIEPKRNSEIPIEEFKETYFKPLFDALAFPEYKYFTKSMILESFMCMMMEEAQSRLCRQCRLEH